MDHGAAKSLIFVGRQRQMAKLELALEDVLAGHVRLVVLTGEPAIYGREW